MAYDEELAERVRAVLGDDGVTERRMFGGIAFMRSGNMVCGVIGEDLLLRLGPEGADAALAEQHTRVMDFTGRPSRNMVYVEPAGVATDEALAAWVRRGLDFVATLPPK